MTLEKNRKQYYISFYKKKIAIRSWQFPEFLLASAGHEPGPGVGPAPRIVGKKIRRGVRAQELVSSFYCYTKNGHLDMTFIFKDQHWRSTSIMQSRFAIMILKSTHY